MNCPTCNIEMEKWESWGDYIQYRCPKCGFKTDNKAALEKVRENSKQEKDPFWWALGQLMKS